MGSAAEAVTAAPLVVTMLADGAATRVVMEDALPAAALDIPWVQMGRARGEWLPFS